MSDTVASELATLQANVAAMATDVQALIAAFQAAQANAGLTPDQATAFDAANAQMAALNASMAAAVAPAAVAPAAATPSP